MNNKKKINTKLFFENYERVSDLLEDETTYEDKEKAKELIEKTIEMTETGIETIPLALQVLIFYGKAVLGFKKIFPEFDYTKIEKFIKENGTIH